MSKNEITLEQIAHAVQVIEQYQTNRNFQALDEILPLAHAMLSRMAVDMAERGNGRKWYAPRWVEMLLCRLAADERPLSNEEYAFFRSEVERLSFGDFKKDTDNIFDYQVKYMSDKEVGDMVAALKHYFQLI